IPTISALAESNPETYIKGSKTVFKGLGAERLKLFYARAVMLKEVTPRPFLRMPVILPIRSVELFFDVEVDPLQDICYLHGFIERRDGKDETERYLYFFTDEVTSSGERDAFAAAVAFLKSRPESVIYYYSKYERTIYRKLQGRYSDVCSA